MSWLADVSDPRFYVGALFFFFYVVDTVTVGEDPHGRPEVVLEGGARRDGGQQEQDAHGPEQAASRAEGAPAAEARGSQGSALATRRVTSRDVQEWWSITFPLCPRLVFDGSRLTCRRGGLQLFSPVGGGGVMCVRGNTSKHFLGDVKGGVMCVCTGVP